MSIKRGPVGADYFKSGPSRSIASGVLTLGAAVLALGLSGPVAAQQQPPGVCVLLAMLDVDTGNCEPQPDPILGVEVAVPERGRAQATLYELGCGHESTNGQLPFFG